MIWLLAVLGLINNTLAMNEKKDFWLQDGKDGIQSIWQTKPNFKKAHNLILMIGDGMGLSTITAGRIYQGQKKGKSGEENKLTFEQFPYLALSKTYNVDRQVPDSAGTAVAMMTGVKVNMATLGVGIDVPFASECKSVTDKSKLKGALHYALEEGKSVGIVTTTRVTHATPAAAFAHIPHRDWECVTPRGNGNCELVKDIAFQLIMDYPNINVILGGGRQYFTNSSTADPVMSSMPGLRNDGLDLIKAWKTEKMERKVQHDYVYTRQQLNALDASSIDYLLGLFAPSHMTYEADRLPSSVEPTLTEMTEKAIQILKKNPKGYFLLIEGGKIDHGHHENGAKKALEELLEFDNAVAKVTEMTSEDDTLTIVTADHSHVFAISGYPTRGNNILGLVDNMDAIESPLDNMPFLTLGYLNGPFTNRTNLTGVDTTASSFHQPGCIKMNLETHAGEDVVIYARGPMAHLFQGTREQSYIGHVMMYSACLGVYKDNCDMPKRNMMLEPMSMHCSAVIPRSTLWTLLGLVVVVVVNQLSESTRNV